jgi:hypothetical protein
MRYFIFFLGCFFSLAVRAQTEADILIKNGRILDGAGNYWIWGDVAMKDGKVLKVGSQRNMPVARIIDAKGLLVAPGFIDVHTHIEGDEFKMLRGAHNTLQRSNNLKLSVCCYHTPGQEKEVSDELIRCGFKTTPSNGFLLLWMQYPLEAPYLRRGVIYAAKGSVGV